MHYLRGAVVVAALGFFGCGTTPSPDKHSDGTRLAESIDVNIAAWLEKPRAELAELCDDKVDYLHKHVESDRANKESELLPDLKPPVAPPVFCTAKYSKKLGVSLPPYLAEDSRDREVAWHLARFGDVDAARKITDTADADLLGKFDQLRCERNYSVEWTRLVALRLFDAELKLARGEVEGASELVHLHRQLDKVLDAKAKSGPLGAALLPIGRRALSMAAPAFREAPFNKKLFADDIDEALKGWKDVPAPQPALTVGADKKDVSRFFRRPQQGRVFASTSADVARAVDLLALPIPSEDVEGVVAFLDGDGRLAELLVHYHGNARLNFPKPVNLAHHLVDHGSTGTQAADAPGVLRQTYLAGAHSYQVSAFYNGSSGSAAMAALIRVGDAKGTLAEPSLPATARDLGAVNLDRSFDQNRLSLDPSLRPGTALETTRESAVSKVRQPVREPRPQSVALTKEADADIVGSVAIRWASNVNQEAVAKLLVPLWAAYGGCRIDGVEDAAGGHLAFVWDNETTRYTMRLPFTEVNSPELVVADHRGADASAQRQQTAAVFDQAQRAARFKAGNPQRRLERWLYDREVALGMPKSEALLRLPKSQTKYRQTNVAGGVTLFFLEPPDPQAGYSPRQLWVRFGPNDRVAEIRVRYIEGPGKPSLFDWLRRDRHGEPEVLASKWANLWSDLGKKGSAALYRWRDDLTIQTYERDAGGSEVTLRDCPLEHPNGVPLPPLQYCSRGVENCRLGDARADVLKRWPAKPTTTTDGALVLGQPGTSAYDLVLVWFENDKVSRIVAQHRAKGTVSESDVPRLLQEAWSHDLDGLGVIRRQEAPQGQLLQGYGWHDDVTRVRIFGQEAKDGPRLLTEWRDWPVAVKAAANQ
jgi:hypothetical protein